jgi:hypothetical protein
MSKRTGMYESASTGATTGGESSGVLEVSREQWAELQRAFGEHCRLFRQSYRPGSGLTLAAMIERDRQRAAAEARA